MELKEVADIIHRIAEGFEDDCLKCLEQNKEVVLQAVREQLYSGQDGDGNRLSPTYDSDPFFEEPGWWYHRASSYKAWKREITPPVKGTMLGLPARDDNVPNLFVDGTFYSEINATKSASGLMIDPGSGNGPDIVAKYGDRILAMGPDAREYFNLFYMLPSIDSFFKRCGYK